MSESDRLAGTSGEAELEAARKLSDLAALSVTERGATELLGSALDVAIAVSNADMGNAQVLNDSGDLEIVVQRGFEQDYLAYWNNVREGRGACGTSLGSGTRVIIEDVEESDIFGKAALKAQLKAGIRSVVSTPLIGRGGNPIGVLSVHFREQTTPDARTLTLLDLVARQATDILEIRKMRDELGESQRRYQALVETTSDFIWETDALVRYTYCSPNMSQLWGLDPATMLGKTPFDVMPEEYREEAARAMAELISSPAPFRVEAVAYNAARETVDLEIKGVPFFDDDGALLGFRGVTRDVTERRHSEEALRQSEARASDLITYAPTGIYEISLDPPRFLSVNDAMSTLSGYSREELMAMSPLDLLDEDSREKLAGRIREALSGETPADEVECTVLRKDGGRMYVELNMKFNYDKRGRPVGAFVIGHDVTERRLSDNAFRAAQTAESEALKAAQESAAREESLKRVAEAASTLLPPGVLAARISEVVAKLLGAQQAQLRLLSENGEFLLSGGAYDPKGFLQTLGDMPVNADTETAICFRTGEIRVGDVGAGVTRESRKNAKAAGVRSFALMPVFAGEQKIGVFYCAWSEPRKFSEAEISFMRAIANQFSVGIQNARLYEAQRKRRHRIEALHQVLELGTSALDVHKAAQRVIDYLCGHHDFDLAAVWLVNGDYIELAAQKGYPPEYDRPVSMSEPFDAVRVVKTGRRIVAENPDNPAVIEYYRSIGMTLGAYVLLPLKARHRVTGVLALVWKVAQDFNQYDLAFYDSMADELALTLDNARLYEQEHSVAETLQDILVAMPGRVPGAVFSKAYESATYQAGRVGGDFIDVFEVGDGLIGVSLGDVSGKGIDAAVTTSLVRTTLRVHAIDGLPPSGVAAKANEVVRRLTNIEAFVTLWFGLLNARTGHLRYVCAGHPPAMVMSPEGELSELECRDAILGAFEDSKFVECQTVLLSGERLVLYSDGATEARSPSGEFLGSDGFKQILLAKAESKTKSLAREVMAGVVSFSKGVLRDDVAILVLEPTGVDLSGSVGGGEA